MNDTLRAKLDSVARHESGVRNSAVGRLLKAIGPTRAFVAVYRRLGPKIDPWLLRTSGGRVGQLFGMPMLLLTSTGAKSGEKRTSPLVYARDGVDFLIVGTNFGTKNHPAWTANLLKHPSAAVTVGAETVEVVAELLDAADFTRHWPSFTRVYPGYDAYLERLTERRPRMFRLRPVG